MSGSRSLAAILLLIPALLPFMEGGGSPSGLLVAHTIVIGCVVVAAVAASRRRLPGAGRFERIGLIALPACACVSFALDGARYGSALSLLNLLAPFVLAWTLRAVPVSSGRARTALSCVVAASTGVQALAMMLLGSDPTLTPSGSFPNANQLAAWIVIGVFVSGGLCLRAREGAGAGGRGLALFGAAVLLIDLAALIRIGSRAAFLSLVVVAAMSIGRLPTAQRSLRRALVAGVVLVTVVGAGAALWRFQRMDDPYRYDRLRIWRAGLQAGIDHPILGMGPGMFERAGYRYNFPLDREMFRFSKTPGSPHSTWIAIFAELGLLGGIAAGCLLAFVVSRGRRGARDGAFEALMACLVMACFDEPFSSPAIALGLTALVVPILPPRPEPARPSPRRAPARLRLALVACACVWGRAVVIPFVAQACYAAGISSPAGAGLVATAVSLEPYNPAYRAARADRALSDPLTIEGFARAHIALSEARRLDPVSTAWAFGLAQLNARASFAIGADEAQVRRTTHLYRETIALGRKDPRPHAELGAYLMAFGRVDEAIARFREALALEPRFLGAGLSLARALVESGRPEEGREALDRFETARRALAGYRPRNRYEEDLMRYESAAVERLHEVLAGPL